jgi:AraC-like DNA-binding protein
MNRPRELTIAAHDDGIDRWETISAAAAPSLSGRIGRYSSYSERTRSFTTRHELASTQCVLIVNLGDPLELVGGDGGTLRLRAGEGFVGGVHMAGALSRSTGEQAGIHAFMPIASLGALAAMPLSELTNRVVPLDDVFGREARTLGEKLGETRDAATRFDLLDALFTRRFNDAATPDMAVFVAARRLAAPDPPSVESLARANDCSRRLFIARFRQAIGVTPGAFARLARFERFSAAIARAPSAELAGLAADAGYYDQPHLNRDVRAFAAMTPGELRARLVPNGGGIRAD